MWGRGFCAGRTCLPPFQSSLMGGRLWDLSLVTSGELSWAGAALPMRTCCLGTGVRAAWVLAELLFLGYLLCSRDFT